MQSLKELIEGAFFHSWQRTAMVLGGIVVALALPVTIILTQQQQDLRQRAASGCAELNCQYPKVCLGDGSGKIWCDINPWDPPADTTPTFDFNNGLDHCRPSNKNCEYFETLISGGCNILPSGKICRLNSPLPDSVPTDSYCSTISSDGYIRHCLPSAVSAPSGWAIQSDAANSVCTTYNGVSSKCYKTTTPAYTEANQKPNCTILEICDQTTCTAPINTCGDSNGKMSCKYYGHPTAGNDCTPADAPKKSCSTFNCIGDAVCFNDQCVAPTATPTNTPTLTPTNTPPTPTTPAEVVDTSPSPSLTQTPEDETHIALEVSLPGIGSNITTQGPGSTNNNPTPLRVTREIEVLLGNAEGANVTFLASGSLTPVSGTLTFSPTTFTYKGEINLGNLPTGNYQVFVRFDNTLYKQAQGFPLLALGQTTAIPALRPLSGDIDRREGSDDDMTIDDYNLFMACYKETEICTPQAKIRADLDDNGIIDTIDLNLILRGFANREGDSPN